jgi:DNA-binding HxlR family transcriptional regulator
MAASTPVPGSPVRGSSTGRPLMAALDLLGRRWALRLLWELRDGPHGGRELRARCDGMSSSVLYERLRELVESGLVHQMPSRRYELTPIGRALGEAIDPLDSWSRRWAAGTDGGHRAGEAGGRRGGPVRPGSASSPFPPAT